MVNIFVFRRNLKFEEADNDYELKFEELRTKIKGKFTIKQHKSTKTQLSRKAYCTTKGCKASVILIHFKKEEEEEIKEENGFPNIRNKKLSEDYGELLISKIPHDPSCSVNLSNDKTADLFSTPEMLTLIKSNKPPKQVIKQYNKETRKNLLNNATNRKKISNIRYTLKESLAKKDEDNIKPIVSLQHLKNFIQENFLSPEEIQRIDENAIFVCGNFASQESFTTVLTTKSLLRNYIKQSLCADSFFCLDGTYRLNILGHPLLILGTVDLAKKFHISKKLINFRLIFL